eukprot:TRINITY_DN3023_c0_g2_i4.p1 TRINITY_DN3023_c0_g2~~TRINITY_DN3023_c0_g2_i4.p1  ORF type:complete len:235 (+),score=20.52 TRINITY_DN3023_c0_g2_i4:162-866(+)
MSKRPRTSYSASRSTQSMRRSRSPSPINPYTVTDSNNDYPDINVHTPRKRSKGQTYSDKEIGSLLVSLYYNEDPNKAYSRWEGQFGSLQRTRASVKQKLNTVRTELLDRILNKKTETKEQPENKLLQESITSAYNFLRPVFMKIDLKYYYVMFKPHWFSIECKYKGTLIRFILTKQSCTTKIKDAVLDTTRLTTLHFKIAPDEMIVGHYEHDDWCGVEVQKKPLPNDDVDDGWE